MIFAPLLAGLVITTCYLPPSSIERHKLYQLPAIPLNEKATSPKQQQVSIVSAQDAVGQLRLLSGLTQEQIADILDVDRRSIYHWLSGQEPSEAKHEKLMRFLSALQYMDRGISSINKKILLSPTEEGKLIKDYLAEGNFQKFMDIVGPGNQMPKAIIQNPAISPLQRGKMKVSEMLSD